MRSGSWRLDARGWNSEERSFDCVSRRFAQHKSAGHSAPFLRQGRQDDGEMLKQRRPPESRRGRYEVKVGGNGEI